MKWPEVEVEKVTKNKNGESEGAMLSLTKPEIALGNSSIAGWKDEITIGFVVYEGLRVGVSVTIRPS